MEIKYLRLLTSDGKAKKFDPIEMKEDLIRKLFTKKLVSWGWHKQGNVPQLHNVVITCYHDNKSIYMDLVDEGVHKIRGWLRWLPNNTRGGNFAICLELEMYDEVIEILKNINHRN